MNFYLNLVYFSFYNLRTFIDMYFQTKSRKQTSNFISNNFHWDFLWFTCSKRDFCGWKYEVLIWKNFWSWDLGSFTSSDTPLPVKMQRETNECSDLILFPTFLWEPSAGYIIFIRGIWRQIDFWWPWFSNLYHGVGLALLKV